MNFDEVTLIEIEDYIQALDENVGLKVETIQDIACAISKQRGLVKKLTIPAVVGQSEQLPCNHVEKLMQGDGFVYAICALCGEDL